MSVWRLSYYFDTIGAAGYNSALMSRMPESIDPWHAAESGRDLEGTLELAAMPRLADLLADRTGRARFALEFFQDAKRRPCVRGTVSAELALICQRCLGPVGFTVEARVSLAVVQGYDEAAALPNDLDPLLVEEGVLRLPDLVEDEILLALPQIPMHKEGEPCSAASGGQEHRTSTDAATSAEADVNPFKVLERLKSNLH